jgi:hypothetical protein
LRGRSSTVYNPALWVIHPSEGQIRPSATLADWAQVPRSWSTCRDLRCTKLFS